MSEEKIILKLLEHDERLERIEQNMVTKDEFKEVTSALDMQTSILKRLDQERAFSSKAISRIFQRLDNQETDIRKLKKAADID